METKKSLKKSCWLTPMILGVMMFQAADGQAAPILQPASVSVDIGTFGGAIDNMRNQSSLSTGYTSGVTDFDLYIASIPTDLCCTANALWVCVERHRSVGRASPDNHPATRPHRRVAITRRRCVHC